MEMSATNLNQPRIRIAYPETCWRSLALANEAREPQNSNPEAPQPSAPPPSSTPQLFGFNADLQMPEPNEDQLPSVPSTAPYPEISQNNARGVANEERGDNRQWRNYGAPEMPTLLADLTVNDNRDNAYRPTQTSRIFKPVETNSAALIPSRITMPLPETSWHNHPNLTNQTTENRRWRNYDVPATPFLLAQLPANNRTVNMSLPLDPISRPTQTAPIGFRHVSPTQQPSSSRTSNQRLRIAYPEMRWRSMSNAEDRRPPYSRMKSRSTEDLPPSYEEAVQQGARMRPIEDHHRRHSSEENGSKY